MDLPHGTAASYPKSPSGGNKGLPFPVPQPYRSGFRPMAAQEISLTQASRTSSSPAPVISASPLVAAPVIGDLRQHLVDDGGAAGG
jgi:hypothetical protein